MNTRKWLLTLLLAISVSFVCVGVTEARGGGGVCFGEWEEEYDPETDTWGHVPGSFNCAMPCATGPCLPYTLEVYPNGDKDKICACQTASGWEYMTVIPEGGHTPVLYCDAMGHWKFKNGLYRDWSAACAGACPPGAPPCRQICFAEYDTRDGKRRRIYFCDCH